MNNTNLRRKMIRFLKENGLNDKNIIEVKQDIIDMENEASEQQMSLEEFLGKDYKEFCIDLLEVGYDFKREDLIVNDQNDIVKLYREIIYILIPSILLSLSTFIFNNFEFIVFIAIELVIAFIITYIIVSRDKDKYGQYKRELIFTNVIAFLILLFFSLPTLNTLGDGIFGNHYNGIYESLLEQWIRVIEYIETEPFVKLNKNIIVVNDYLFSFSFVLLLGYAIYSHLFKKKTVKYFLIPLAIIGIILVLFEYFTTLQIPFSGALIFIFVLVFYIKQFNQLKFSKYQIILYALGGFFTMVLLLSIFMDFEFIESDELYYGQDLLYVIKLLLIGYLSIISIFTLFGIKKVSVIQEFYTYFNIFIIAYAMFMITSYMYQGIEYFNIEQPLESWQSIRIINQMAFAAFGYYITDSLIRKFSNLDNKD